MYAEQSAYKKKDEMKLEYSKPQSEIKSNYGIVEGNGHLMNETKTYPQIQ